MAQEIDLHEWFKTHTFHNREFRNVSELLKLKKEQGVKISLAIPTLNEADNVGHVISVIKSELLDKKPLLDEIIVIDSGSSDGTIEIAKEAGARVFLAEKCLKEEGIYFGKGENLWKSLHILKGDIIVWIDADIKNMHPKFVYGLVGPLLKFKEIGYVKGFYRRPIRIGKQIVATGGGRTTEIMVRPFFNYLFPELSGFIQPLSGEYAGRREILEKVPFFIGYGVETGLLIDIMNRFGLNAMAQVDLDVRVHRNHSIIALGRQSFGILQVLFKRASDMGRIRCNYNPNTLFRRPKKTQKEYLLTEKEIVEKEREPIINVSKYHSKRIKTALQEAFERLFGLFR